MYKEDFNERCNMNIGDKERYYYWHAACKSEYDNNCNRGDNNLNKCNRHDCDECERHDCDECERHG